MRTHIEKWRVKCVGGQVQCDNLIDESVVFGNRGQLAVRICDGTEETR